MIHELHTCNNPVNILVKSIKPQICATHDKRQKNFNDPLE